MALGEVCGRSDRWVQGGITSGICSELLLMMDRLTDEVRQEFPWTAMFATDPHSDLVWQMIVCC